MWTQRARGKTWIGVCALALSLGGFASACSDSNSDKSGEPAGGAGGGTASEQKLVILHTNDIHSHLMGHSPEADYTPATLDDDATRGGIARLASAIQSARAEAETNDVPVMLLDAGDFMMGTLFELLASQRPAELGFMQALGYDATTIGNHELDWTPAGLAQILLAASRNDVHVPIVASNIRFSAADAGDDELEAAADAGLIQSKLIKTVGSLKVGIFGLLGADAVQVTPQARPLTFESIAAASRRMVAELRDEDGVDLVIALSHSGISSDGTGEDATLANNVPGIDVIVSGHTHEFLREPARVGQTLIVSAGSYGMYLGKLELTVTPSSSGAAPTVAVDGYTLLDIDDKIRGDAATQDAVNQSIAAIDQVLAPGGLSYSELVATTEVDLPLPARTEAPVGNLVTDAYRAVTSALDPDEPAVIAVEANGQLRSPIVAGQSHEVWLADLFRVTPIGIGTDQEPGFPLVTFYLNASDIRSGLELSAAHEVLSNDYFLQIAGVKVEYDMSAQLFGRVARIALETPDGDETLDPTDTTTCYKVVTTNYVAGLLGVVKGTTSGLLAVEAKDKDCTTLVDPTTRYIDSDPGRSGVQQLKNWQALLQYVSALPDLDGDGTPNVPAAYGSAQGRIVEQ